MSSPALLPDVAPGKNRRVAMGWGVLAAVLLTVVFWHPLWQGGGLIGGDTYTYFFPQKAYFAETIRAGDVPLWNNRIGNGYPQVAESQTGVFYPFHLVLFPLLELNTAYSANLITHYVLAFVFTWMFARRLGLAPLGAGLAALVYTYGWFPPRICLEWSIIGGTWLPLALWCAESFCETRHWRYLFGLTATLAVQMLAGHYTLAFITQLTLAGFVPLRLWLVPQGPLGATSGARGSAAGMLALAVVAAFFVAAFQLLPSWELKQFSQRASVTREHDPAIASIPVLYLSQIALPWVWYPDETSFNNLSALGRARTNRVEAHLYFGLIPLALVVWRLWGWRQNGDRRLAVVLILGTAALVYTTGCLVPITKYLPGFSFFEGPSRYGIVTTLAAGLLGGSGLDELRKRTSHAGRGLLVLVVFAGTTADLYVVSKLVTYAIIVPNPPTKLLEESPLRKVLASQPQPARILSEGNSLPSLLGVATFPSYLGLGPAQYFDPALAFPQPWPFFTPPTREQIEWLHRAGVTHYLSFRPNIDRRLWSAKLVWEGEDPFLNAALARSGERSYLYELEGSRGRAGFGRSESDQSVLIVEYRANRVVVATDSPVAGRLILTDLEYPGWNVAVDDQAAESLVVDKMFRGLDLTPGRHTVTWTYRPKILYWGAGISSLTVFILLAIAHVRYWRPHVFERLRR